MYELQDPTSNTYRTNSPFFENQIQEEGPVKNRTCTDMFCLVLFLLFVGAFIAILIYALASGDPRSALAIHNYNGVNCNQQTGYTYGYFAIPGSTQNAMCVSQCPKNGQTVNCLVDGKFCATGQYTAPKDYSSFNIAQYCVPDASIGGKSITSYFDYNIIVQWIFDIQDGYLILIGAALAAVVVVLIYSCLLRCLTGCILYTALGVVEIVILGVGILLILEASQVKISNNVPINLASLSVTELYVAGSVLIFVAILFLIAIICICSKLELGVKIVQTASIFLSQRFYLALIPIISTVLLFGTFAAILAGGIFIYGTGSRTLAAHDAFFAINFTPGLIVLFVVYGFAGYWMICWLFYSNSFTVISAASIWYYQHDSPLCTSVYRLLRYHVGSVAFTALLFGIFFFFRIIAKLFHLINASTFVYKLGLFAYAYLTSNLLMIFRFLKFLSQGVFVQIAMRSTNYCISSLESFKLLSSNPIKITITGAISYMVSILGILFTMACVCTGAYFIQLNIPYFYQKLTDPIPVTVVSGVIVAVVSGVYLSVMSDSAEAIIQCYLIDQGQSRVKGLKAKFAPDHLKLILENHMSG